ncbi:hypothetical protein ILYODFUR_004122 [Ilyodon furcidens]|uniref:Uncharacterized protein n=1 Tax=Ilyodon furcidens TaxID=33524 RepID=A0ABV0USJ4_9TELE
MVTVTAKRGISKRACFKPLPFHPRATYDFAAAGNNDSVGVNGYLWVGLPLSSDSVRSPLYQLQSILLIKPHETNKVRCWPLKLASNPRLWVTRESKAKSEKLCYTFTVFACFTPRAFDVAWLAALSEAG